MEEMMKTKTDAAKVLLEADWNWDEVKEVLDSSAYWAWGAPVPYVPYIPFPTWPQITGETASSLDNESWEIISVMGSDNKTYRINDANKWVLVD